MQNLHQFDIFFTDQHSRSDVPNSEAYCLNASFNNIPKGNQNCPYHQNHCLDRDLEHPVLEPEHPISIYSDAYFVLEYRMMLR